VDPDLAETDQPYAYAGDDPVNEGDPTGLDQSINLKGVANWARTNGPEAWKDGYNDDCTDFVSRALSEGGDAAFNYGPDWPFDHTDPHYWFPAHDIFGIHVPASYSWAESEDLYEYLQINRSPLVGGPIHLGPSGGCPNQDGPYKLPSGIQQGDVIFANFESSASAGIQHAGIVVGVEAGNLTIAQHSENVVETLSDWQYLGAHHGEPGSDTYVWIVQPQQLPTGALIA